ncbi:DUF4231 domain-containing protein [Modestobacter excelsi]|uniref:DUF4231 domain-containing protein n=1 Tax=Modestobacter excelsi TaxID=2213161 RepID=UPI00110CE3BC|nr:DUF4231 domain-containing protein [Modestobacter excelsi]
MVSPDGTGARVDPGSNHPAWARLLDQLDWYDRKSSSAQRAFTRLKVVELFIAAAVPVVAGAGGSTLLIATLGAAVLVLEAVQQLFQWQTNWVLYRSTAEALKHEKYLFLSSAGPYASADRLRVLAERIEGLISQEHAKWTQGRERAEPGPPRAS